MPWPFSKKKQTNPERVLSESLEKMKGKVDVIDIKEGDIKTGENVPQIVRDKFKAGGTVTEPKTFSQPKEDGSQTHYLVRDKKGFFEKINSDFMRMVSSGKFAVKREVIFRVAKNDGTIEYRGGMKFDTEIHGNQFLSRENKVGSDGYADRTRGIVKPHFLIQDDGIFLRRYAALCGCLTLTSDEDDLPANYLFDAKSNKPVKIDMGGPVIDFAESAFFRNVKVVDDSGKEIAGEKPVINIFGCLQARRFLTYHIAKDPRFVQQKKNKYGLYELQDPDLKEIIEKKAQGFFTLVPVDNSGDQEYYKATKEQIKQAEAVINEALSDKIDKELLDSIKRCVELEAKQNPPQTTTLERV